MVASDLWSIGVDEKTLQFLVALRQQVPRGAERVGGDALNVQAEVAAVELDIEPESPEHDALLFELVRDGYLSLHPQTIYTNTSQGYIGSPSRG